MKIKKITLIVLSFLPLIVCLIALNFMPDTIPAHYNADFMIDRYGSKYEALIFPIVIVFLGAVFLLPALAVKSEVNKKLLLNFGIIFILLFNGLSFYIIYVQATQTMLIQLDKVMMVLIGIVIIILGNLMPMSRRNSIVGIRTKWSLKNDTVWKKCQMFGGVSLIITGIAFCVFAFIFSNVLFIPAALLVVALINVIYSYFAAKKYSDPTDEAQ